MVERIVAAVCVALLGWLDKRISQSPTAIDADVDRAHLQRAGDRIREWMRKQPNGVHPGGQSEIGRAHV